jgi:hypothetical protein
VVCWFFWTHRLLSYFAVKHSPLFSGGFYKFSGPYLKHLPIRRIDFNDPEEVKLHDELAKLSEHCRALTDAFRAARAPQERTGLRRQLRGAQRRLDELVNHLYSLTSHERVLLDTHPDGL